MIENKNIRTKYLSNKLINNICILKDSYWKFGISSQKEWFKINNKKNDLHNLLFYKKKLVGYTCLRKKKIFFGKIKKYYLLFDTLIINKKYRKLNLSNILMKYNNNVIIKSHYYSFLLCDKKLIKFYKKFLWKNANFNIKIDTKHQKLIHKKIMYFNFNNSELKKTKIIIEI